MRDWITCAIIAAAIIAGIVVNLRDALSASASFLGIA